MGRDEEERIRGKVGASKEEGEDRAKGREWRKVLVGWKSGSFGSRMTSEVELTSIGVIMIFRLSSSITPPMVATGDSAQQVYTSMH